MSVCLSVVQGVVNLFPICCLMEKTVFETYETFILFYRKPLNVLYPFPPNLVRSGHDVVVMDGGEGGGGACKTRLLHAPSTSGPRRHRLKKENTQFLKYILGALFRYRTTPFAQAAIVDETDEAAARAYGDYQQLLRSRNQVRARVCLR